MSAYPATLTLPYRVSREWLEERTLAGELAEPVHSLTIELELLDDDLRERATALYFDVDTRAFERTGTVEIISSGIEHRNLDHADGRTVGMAEPITSEIGVLPELPQPTDDPETLIGAYEAWRDRYVELAPTAMQQWIAVWDTDDDADEDGMYPNGADWTVFAVDMRVRVDGQTRSANLDARVDDLELFRRAKAASELYHYAANTVSDDAWHFARQVVGPGGAELPGWLPDEEAVPFWEAYAGRVARVAFSRWWTRQRQTVGFDAEMLRWARQHGSERLQMGIADGYRMMPVYLRERIEHDVPGFFAHLPKDNDGISWQPRTGPSEEALRLRRAVEARLRDNTQPGAPAPKVEIAWIKNPPMEMCEPSARIVDYDDDYPVDDDAMREDPFEVIVIPAWLGRYTLFGAVWTEDDDQPADYVLCRYLLRPDDYGIDDLPTPPESERCIAAWRQERRYQPTVGVGDDDIPF